MLPKLSALHLYRYEGEVAIDGVRFPIRPGVVSIVPPGALMEYRFLGPSEHLYAHLALPGTGTGTPVPQVQDMGVDGPHLFDRVRAAALAARPGERTAEMWSVLWTIARMRPATSDDRPDPHPAVTDAVAYVEANLADRLTVATIAAAVRFSPSHLDRLVRASTGASLGEYVRRRRAEVARHLLRDTSQSVATIAAAVGVPDLHAFNKFCRARLGASPRRIRS